jgi:hypothetical protein
MSAVYPRGWQRDLAALLLSRRWLLVFSSSSTRRSPALTLAMTRDVVRVLSATASTCGTCRQTGVSRGYHAAVGFPLGGRATPVIEPADRTKLIRLTEKGLAHQHSTPA